jgi:alginate lyase
MRSPIIAAAFVSCSWLAALACSGAGSSPRDSSAGAGSAGTSASAGTTGTGGGSAGASASDAGSFAGSFAGSSSLAGGSGASGATNGGAGGAGGSGPNPGGGIIGPTGLVHPGILVNKDMLDFVKSKITMDPWKSALSHASGDNAGSLSYTAKPRATVECGPSSNPDLGCTDEKNDVIAAYTQALLWYYTGDQKHADKAIEIMNAWSAVLKEHTNDNAQLQAAWCAEIFPRAAEIIRYTNAGWSDTDIKQFTDMLNTAYYPEVKDGSTRTGNWDTSAIDAAMNIAVFNDDMTEFNKTVDLWKARTPAYVYLTTDGALPVQPPRESRRSGSSLEGYWYNPKAFIDGIGQETCRDVSGTATQAFGHQQYGVAGIINAAETARIQGVDLFSLEEKRLVAFLELHAKYINGGSTTDLCTTAQNKTSADPMWEIGYNAYANVLGQSLPETKQLLQNIRPTDATHHMAWETLTHGDIGAVGLSVF